MIGYRYRIEQQFFLKIMLLRLVPCLLHQKGWNEIVSPMWSKVNDYMPTYNQDGEVQLFDTKSGSKMHPEYPSRLHAETYCQWPEDFKYYCCMFVFSMSSI